MLTLIENWSNGSGCLSTNIFCKKFENLYKKYKTVEFSDEQKQTYEKYYFVNNRLSGAILIGDTSKLVDITMAVEEHRLFNKMF